MRSIRGKFTLLNVVSILLCAALIGSVSLVRIYRAQEESSDQIMLQTCRQQAARLDAGLRSIQSSVDIFSEVAEGSLHNLSLLKNSTWLERFLADMDEYMVSIARNTLGVCTYYLRVDPEMTLGEEGFFYTRHADQTGLNPEPLTDLSKYDPSDTEHVGWFYQPRDAGRPIWMEPYYNKNVGIYMVSYIVPLYHRDTFWGVVGMDVDFDVVIEDLRELNPYQTGYAFLCGSDGKIYYHPTLENGTRITDAVDELHGLIDDLIDDDSADESVSYSYRYNGTEKKLTFCHLQNGMNLMLTAETSEIHRDRSKLTLEIVAIALLLSLAIVLLILPVANRITKPLVSLTKAADQIAKGNMDVRFPTPGRDEVGILTNSMTKTVRSLKTYIAGMSDAAYTDALTHVKNKAAYEIACQRLQEEMEAGTADYAILMVDFNNLKRVNDQYGHELGDEYLRAGCQLVCACFKRSPVFRLGGDEFAAILERSDLEHMETLLDQLEDQLIQTRKAAEPWNRVSLAWGAARLRPEDRTPADVFRRADQAMYLQKHSMKQHPGGIP